MQGLRLLLFPACQLGQLASRRVVSGTKGRCCALGVPPLLPAQPSTGVEDSEASYEGVEAVPGKCIR